MKTKLTARLTYANVMATTAVFIALGGTSYAALTITGKNVKNGSLSGADIRNSSITGSDVANGSLVTRDFKPGVLPAGPQGPPGPPGPKGAPAPAATVAGYSGRATNVPVGGYDMVISKDLPAGKYMLSASAEIRGAGSPSGYMGGISVVQCSIPGYETHDFYLSPNGTYVS
ncbi:MAG TPA: hypothetical protein VER33_17780, partial [Polyangiaceae bacterium]|nr:hypothetical protein [Polyangiaceae bacterium]